MPRYIFIWIIIKNVDIKTCHSTWTNYRDSMQINKKRLKIPKGKWEYVHQRRTNKGEIRRRKSKKDKQYNDQEKKAKGQTIIYKTLQRKLQIVKWWFGRVSSSCSTNGSRRVTLATNSVICHEWGEDRVVITTNGTYSWLFVTQIFRNGQIDHGGYRTTFEVMTST